MTESNNFYSDRPTFFGILIDASGSMSGYVDDVVKGHSIMLQSLRECEKCHRGVLYISQSLFDGGHPNSLHGFYALDKDGKDQVVSLSQNNYQPSGLTALYDAVLAMLTELDLHLQQVQKKGFLPDARIAIITDGGENNSNARLEQVVEAIKKLRDREWLVKSVVIGLKNPDFDEPQINMLRESIGFSTAISLNRSPREIRRAFGEASKVAANNA